MKLESDGLSPLPPFENGVNSCVMVSLLYAPLVQWSADF